MNAVANGVVTPMFVKFQDGKLESISTKDRLVKCSDIWMANISDKSGSIQCGHRPVFIISNDKNNQYSSTINVLPMTSKMNKRNLPCHVEIWNYRKYGLAKPSTIMTEQIMTIEKYDLRYYIGKIVDLDMLMNIYRALQSQFPLLDVMD